MSESPVVSIACAEHNSSLKAQTYTNLSITQSPSQLLSIKAESDFYNSIISIEKESPKDIYGFISTNTDLSYDYSIEHIVNFFQQDERIESVVCDILNKNSIFQSFEYINPRGIEHNIPFFIRGSVLKEINFPDTAEMFTEVLNDLTQQQRIIFHVGEPLIITTNESPV